MSQLKVNSIVPSGGLPAGASGGGIIQVVNTPYTSDFYFNSSSAVDVTSFNTSMACTSTNSKVLIICQASMYNNSANQEMMLRVKIGASTYTNWVSRSYNTASGIGGNVTLVHLYSPASTSSITYQVQVLAHNGGNCYMNRDFDGVNNQASSITLYEISG
jgi:hypothetical protein